MVEASVLKRSVRADAVSVCEFDDVMRVVLTDYYDNTAYEHLFFAADENGDGVLEYDEFVTLVRTIDSDGQLDDMEELEMIRMFRRMVSMTPEADGDVVLPSAFAMVAKQHGRDALSALIGQHYITERDSAPVLEPASSLF